MLKHDFRKGDFISGVTSLGKRLFVLRCLSRQQIQEYSATTFSKRRTWPVADLCDHAFGLASCAANNCLYVSDYDDGMVFCVVPTSGGGVSNWRTDSGPAGLSVNSEQNLLVTCWRSNVIVEYTTRGALV
jgi:hypothetical protein